MISQIILMKFQRVNILLGEGRKTKVKIDSYRANNEKIKIKRKKKDFVNDICVYITQKHSIN